MAAPNKSTVCLSFNALTVIGECVRHATRPAGTTGEIFFFRTISKLGINKASLLRTVNSEYMHTQFNQTIKTIFKNSLEEFSMYSLSMLFKLEINI